MRLRRMHSEEAGELLDRGFVAAGLYVHVPFCLTRCAYCDFATQACDEVPPDFVAAVLAEAERYAADREAALVMGRPLFFGRFDSLYLGGGTPSRLPPDAWGPLLSGLRERLSLHDLQEVTAEANPDDVTPGLLEAMAAAGVTRISLGVQSLREEDLRWLGRRHGVAHAIEAARSIKAQGLSLAVDLMYGLPRASESAWREVLLRATSLAPEHLSCYELTVEPGTPLGTRRAAGEKVTVDEDLGRELFLMTRALLEAEGFEQYEVSNYARGAMHRSLHNQKYWDHAPYLGLGPAAHSFAGRRRWWNHAGYDDYRQAVARTGSGRCSGELLETSQLRLERLMLGLRRSDGLPVSFLCSLEGGATVLEELRAQGLLSVSEGRARPTIHGLLVADRLPLRFSDRSGR